MGKKRRTRSHASGVDYFEYCKHILNDKYFNLWMKKYKFEGEEIDYRKNWFIMKKLFADGRICAFKSPDDHLEFAMFTPNGYDLYDTPTHAMLIDNRGSVLIPKTLQKIDEDIVVMYLLDSKNTIRESVEWYIEEIALTKTIIRTNLHTQNMPFLLAMSSIDQERIKDIMNRVLDGELVIGCDFADIDKIKVLNGGATYVIDKLYKYIKDLESELNTYLGINNTGIEKQERLLVDEVNANNQEIAQHEDIFMEAMTTFCERIQEVLGFTISVKSFNVTEKQASNQEDIPEDKEGQEDEI